MPSNDLNAIRHWPSVRAQPWLLNFIRESANNPCVTAIVAIGSAIRQRVHARSDLDLLVLYSDGRPRLRPPGEIDIRAYPAENADRLISEGHEVLGWAVKFGRPLYDPKGIWRSLVKSWTNRLPMPSAENALHRGVTSLDRAKEMLRAGDETAAYDLALAALTQLVRTELIKHGVYPASRPELSSQLREVLPDNPLASLLDQALYKDISSAQLVAALEASGQITVRT